MTNFLLHSFEQRGHAGFFYLPVISNVELTQLLGIAGGILWCYSIPRDDTTTTEMYGYTNRCRKSI